MEELRKIGSSFYDAADQLEKNIKKAYFPRVIQVCVSSLRADPTGVVSLARDNIVEIMDGDERVGVLSSPQLEEDYVN